MLPFNTWSRLYNHIEIYFRPPGEGGTGVLDVFHRQLAKTVQRLYVATEADSEKKAYRQELATFFANTTMGERRANQQPFYHHAIEDWEGLKQCLSDLNMFFLLYSDATKFEFLKYWHALIDSPIPGMPTRAISTWTSYGN